MQQLFLERRWPLASSAESAFGELAIGAAAGALSELDEYLEMLRKALEQNYQRLDRLFLKQRRKDGKS